MSWIHSWHILYSRYVQVFCSLYMVDASLWHKFWAIVANLSRAASLSCCFRNKWATCEDCGLKLPLKHCLGMLGLALTEATWVQGWHTGSGQLQSALSCLVGADNSSGSWHHAGVSETVCCMQAASGSSCVSYLVCYAADRVACSIFERPVIPQRQHFSIHGE